MIKKLSFLFLTAAFVLSACSTLEVTIDQTPTPVVNASDVATVVAATLTAEPIQVVATLPATEQPVVDLPTFSNVAFYRTSVKPANCGEEDQHIFPARILQVHSHWDYANMRAGLIIRREWYSNGTLWAKYEEPWDFAKYGAKGTIKDMPIYDFDAGLAPGNYELRLYIDGQPQFDAASPIGFVVDKDWSLEIVSPNGRSTAVISLPQKLTIRQTDGVKWDLAQAHEIQSLAWFADSQHIVYADTDRSRAQGCTTVGIRHKLWIIDAATSTQQQIGRDDQNLHNPLLSPNGQYITAMSGSGYGATCMVDLSLGLVFVELDNKLQQVRSLDLQDFAGIPAAAVGSFIYPVNNGIWKDNTHFETGLSWTCAPSNNPGGIYLFDLTAKRATRTGDLPKP